MKECTPEQVLMTFVLFSEVNGSTQNAVARPPICSDRPRVFMKIRVPDVQNLDDEIQTEKQVYHLMKIFTIAFLPLSLFHK